MSKRANGLGSVYQDKKRKTWTAVCTVGYKLDGQPMRKTKKGFATKKEATLYLETLRNEAPKATVAALWEIYHRTGFLDLSADKQRHYEAVYNRLKPLWKRDIDSLTIDDLQRLIEPYSAYYAQKDIKTVMSHLYNLAIAQRMTQINLTPYMRLVKHEEEKGQAWNEQELEQFWKGWSSGDKMCGYILFMSYTGTMPGELRNIHKSMIDYDAHEINGAGLKTQTRKDSPIVLCDKIIPVLKDLMQDTLVLWPRPKQAFYDEYHICLARCGIEYKAPYTCRHTAATLVASENNTLITQKIMRHARSTTTERYVHPNSEKLLEAVNKI